MMIAITSANGALDAGFDPHFGRAAYYYIVDLALDPAEVVANSAVNAASGAGVQAAQLMGKYSVTSVISGSFGPKAFKALNAAGITMYVVPNGDSLTVGDVLEHYRAGQLQPLTTPSHDGSHGGGKY